MAADNLLGSSATLLTTLLYWDGRRLILGN